MDSIIIIDTSWKVHLPDLEHQEIITQRNNVTLYRSLWRKYQPVCVKCIKVTPQNHKYVQREFDIVKICAHPCVYQFYGACVNTEGTDEYVYFVFEYMENGNLLEYIKGRCLSTQERVHIIYRIAVGMHYLFSRKPVSIIHRDFKPENILVNRYGEVKIADFGISKQMLNQEQEPPSWGIEPLTYSSIGTLRWTAPEILSTRTYGRTCDIYSIGLLIYFIFTGQLPYWNLHNNGAKIAYAKLNDVRPFLDDLNDLPEVEQLVRACTERDPMLRPQTPEDIIRILTTWKF